MVHGLIEKMPAQECPQGWVTNQTEWVTAPGSMPSGALKTSGSLCVHCDSIVDVELLFSTMHHLGTYKSDSSVDSVVTSGSKVVTENEKN